MKHIQVIPGEKTSTKIAMRAAIEDMKKDKSVRNAALALVGPSKASRMIPQLELLDFDELVAIRESDMYGVHNDEFAG